MKIILKKLFRLLYLMFFYDRLIYYYSFLKNYKSNKNFRFKNPSLKLPPNYIIFESFGLNCYEFYNGGKETAQWLVTLFEEFISLKKLNILEWGCGPGRIIRHFPELTNSECNYFATDYNPKSISWCKKKLKILIFKIIQYPLH